MAKQKSISAGGDTATPAKTKGTNPFVFLQQVRNEAAKVTWTSQNETIVSTVMVLIMVAFAALFFFIVDQGLSWLVKAALNLTS